MLNIPRLKRICVILRAVRVLHISTELIASAEGLGCMPSVMWHYSGLDTAQPQAYL